MTPFCWANMSEPERGRLTSARILTDREAWRRSGEVRSAVAMLMRSEALRGGGELGA